MGELDDRFSCGLDINDPALARTCERLKAEGGKLWEKVGAEDADIMVYPHNVYEADGAVLRASQVAEAKGVECLFFRCHDSSRPVELPYGVVYQTSAFASQLGDSNLVLPAFVCDYMQGLGEGGFRVKKERPKVGFCGFTGTTIQRVIYQLQMRTAKALGLKLRDAEFAIFGRD